MKRCFATILTLVALIAVGCSSTVTPTPTPTPLSSATPTATPAPTTSGTPKATPTPTPKHWSSAPAMMIDTNKSYTAIIETEKGNMTFELFAKDMPITVNNFVFLARQGFYDNCTFHRVLPNFVAQGGDPTGTGMGGPGYHIPFELSWHTHTAGAISMASEAAASDTAGSQFFIVFNDNWHSSLDGGYSVFGQLTSGWSVLQSLTLRDPDSNPPPTYKGDTIYRITIIES